MFQRLLDWLLGPVTSQPAPCVVFPPDTSLLEHQGFVPENFRCGVEILNDNETSLEFVVSALQEHAGMKRKAALLAAVNIHMKGGVILELKSLEDAERLAAAIVRSARGASFPLVCRALTAQQGAAGDVRDARA
jgi:ATP-dependent Clp protease adapter protein ClpS